MIDTYTVAKFYVACGYSVVPVLPNGTKKPAIAWEYLKSRRPSYDEIEKWFSEKANGIALVQGMVSGRQSAVAELLEFETEAVYDLWVSIMINQGHSKLCNLLDLVVASPGGGRHLYYRHLDAPQGNQKLARGHALVEGHNGDTLIETRGEGGYVLAPGSPAACHKSGKEYRLLSGSFKRVPLLSAEQRAIVFTACRSLDERPVKATAAPRPVHIVASGEGKPGEDFDERGGPEALACLMRHGWSVEQDYGDWQMLCRPGKSTGTSATFGKVAPGVLHVFSSNSAPFDMESNSGPFKVLTLLDFGGDFKACAKHLAGQGFGTPLPPPADRPQPPRPATDKHATPRADRLQEEADYEAMKQEAREAHIRLVAILKLCELGAQGSVFGMSGWPDPLPTENPVLLSMSKTMALADCIEFLLSEVGTPNQGEAWGLLRDIDDAMDEADVYIEHYDCVAHYLGWLHSRYPVQEDTEGDEAFVKAVAEWAQDYREAGL
jgi:hypothetical protein